MGVARSDVFIAWQPRVLSCNSTHWMGGLRLVHHVNMSIRYSLSYDMLSDVDQSSTSHQRPGDHANTLYSRWGHAEAEPEKQTPTA